MLVFKFAMIAPHKLIYAAMLLASVTLLLVGLAYYMKNVGKDIKWMENRELRMKNTNILLITIPLTNTLLHKYTTTLTNQ